MMSYQIIPVCAQASPTQTSAAAPQAATENARQYFQQAIAALASVESERANTKISIVEKAKIVANNQRALELVRRGLQLPSTHSTPEDVVEGTDEAAEMERHSGYRKLARLLVMQGDVFAAQEDWPKAANAYADVVQLGSRVSEGVLMNLLVGDALNAIGQSALWPVISRLDSESAAKLAKRLEDSSRENTVFAATVREEVRFSTSRLSDIFRDPEQLAEARRYFQDQMEWEIGRSAQPYIVAGQRPASPEALLQEAEAGEVDAIAPNVVTRESIDRLIPIIRRPLAQARFNFTVRQTQHALLTTAVVLQAYHEQHKSYPSQLSDLTPAFLQKVPLDPFGYNEPLCYATDGKTYRLWSIGPDGLDSEGLAIEDRDSNNEKQKYRVQAYSLGDIVAGINR